MITVTLDEPRVNAVRAALDLQILSLRATLQNLLTHPQDVSRDFAIETTSSAIVWSERAKTTINESLADDVPEYPATMTVVQLDWNEVELRGAWGDR